MQTALIVGLALAVLAFGLLWRREAAANHALQRESRQAAAGLDTQLAELAERLAEERGLTACPATIWYFFDKRGITHKKRRRMPASSSARI